MSNLAIIRQAISSTALLVSFGATSISAQSATLEAVGSPRCTSADCSRYDAVVFVHGIYGSRETFVNTTTGFDWPASLPREIKEAQIDVYRLNYGNALLSWAKKKNPQFQEVARSVITAMAPLRHKRYRSIGFVTHSLGGNVVSTYMHTVKTSFGHPHRSQHAYTITLATPVLGADIANKGTLLKQLLGMNDDLLGSLERDNLYLRMLLEWREAEMTREQMYDCRPVHLHAAYEKERIDPLLIFSPQSAGQSVSKLVNSAIVGFDLDHSEIAKPTGRDHVVYQWVIDRMENEYVRINSWNANQYPLRLCRKSEWIPEPLAK